MKGNEIKIKGINNLSNMCCRDDKRLFKLLSPIDSLLLCYLSMLGGKRT